MNLRRLGEFGLIESIRRMSGAGKGVRIGIGDDCAWVSHPAGSSLVTADLLIESIHFDLRWTSFEALGHKSLAVNLSDIAAMGGLPAYAVLSLGIPQKLDSQRIVEFYRGFNRLAKRCGVAVIGGDTNIARSFIVSVCVIGHAPARPVQRSGARVGDDIYVTGTLGDSALGLALLRKQLPGGGSAAAGRLLLRHHRPMPRLTAGVALARRKLAAAMIDISDGLLQDLGHICRASRTGALIWHERLPLSRDYLTVAGKLAKRLALHGGEDYELLFCARPRFRKQIANLSDSAKIQVSRIGRCVPAAQGIMVIDAAGKAIRLRHEGHDHFKSSGHATL
jgi:thiamine-monophosphate kinase